MRFVFYIGILIAALLPRLQGAQAMARDTARQTALTTIGTAIAAYQLQVGRRPLQSTESTWSMPNSTGTKEIAGILKEQGIITDVPLDRNQTNTVFGLGAPTDQTIGDFQYLVLPKNKIANGGFMLMARTEMPGSSNRVVKSTGTLTDGNILDGTDMSNVALCTSVTLNTALTDAEVVVASTGDTECKANSQSQLRYVYMY